MYSSPSAAVTTVSSQKAHHKIKAMVNSEKIVKIKPGITNANPTAVSTAIKTESQFPSRPTTHYINDSVYMYI